MAIEVTKTVTSITIQYTGSINPAESAAAGEVQKPSLVVNYEVIVDDPDDNMLPVKNMSSRVILSEDSDGNATDVSGEDEKIQTIAAAVWAD